jgi:hypothetical protein
VEVEFEENATPTGVLVMTTRGDTSLEQSWLGTIPTVARNVRMFGLGLTASAKQAFVPHTLFIHRAVTM